MPELVEVEMVVRGLRGLVGRRVRRVRFGKIDFIRNPERIGTLLPGSRIEEIARRGKLILVGLHRQSPGPKHFWLLIHLGMTGQLMIHDPGDPVQPHTHVWFSLDDGKELRYVDIRRFGQMRLALPEEMEARIAPLGADPLQVPEKEFRECLGSRRARVKALLLDQRVLRGLGNIYTDESLWQAGLHPKRIGSELTPEELHTLWQSIREVVRRAMRRRGTSIANYVDARGRRGTNQKWLCVYRRRGLPCSRCGAKIEREIVAGRSSYFCPRCQPESVKARRGRRRTLTGNPIRKGRR